MSNDENENVISVDFVAKGAPEEADLKPGIDLIGWEKVDSVFFIDELPPSNITLPEGKVEFTVSMTPLCTMCNEPLSDGVFETLDAVIEKRRNAAKCPSCGIRLV